MKDAKINNDSFIEVTSVFNTLIKGTLVGIISIILFSALSSIMVGYSLISTSSIKLISIITLFIGGLFGAYITARKYGYNGMILGIVTGLSILFVIVMAGVLFQTVSFEIIDFSLFFVKLFDLMLAGAIGGIIGINVRE